MKIRKSISKIALLTTLVAAFLSLGIATPAHAAERTVYKDGCWVTPRTPRWTGNSSHPKVVDYEIKVKCVAHSKAYLDQVVFEDDEGWTDPNDRIASRYGVYVPFSQSSGTVTKYVHWYVNLPDTERGREAMFQEVKFRVKSGGLVGHPTGWIQSPNLYIAN